VKALLGWIFIWHLDSHPHWSDFSPSKEPVLGKRFLICLDFIFAGQRSLSKQNSEMTTTRVAASLTPSKVQRPGPPSTSISHNFALMLSELVTWSSIGKLARFPHAGTLDAQQRCEPLFTSIQCWTMEWSASKLSQRVRPKRKVGRPLFLYLMGFIAASPGIFQWQLSQGSGWLWDAPGKPLQP
jgi:hypothetical protein